MKAKIPIVAAGVMLFAAVAAQGTMIDFYQNGVIQDGDIYDRVTVWGDAIVVITGGQVSQIVQNDSSEVTVIDVNGVWWFELGDSSTANIYGGDYNILYAPSDNSSFHIYGYGFAVERPSDLWRVTGFWPDGAPLEVLLRRADTYGDHYVLHELPEPTSITLLASGILLQRRRRKGTCPLRAGT